MDVQDQCMDVTRYLAVVSMREVSDRDWILFTLSLVTKYKNKHPFITDLNSDSLLCTQAIQLIMWFWNCKTNGGDPLQRMDT